MGNVDIFSSIRKSPGIPRKIFHRGSFISFAILNPIRDFFNFKPCIENLQVRECVSKEQSLDFYNC